LPPGCAARDSAKPEDARPRHDRRHRSRPGHGVLRPCTAAAGYGRNRKAFFWIGRREVVATGAHIAFFAPDRPTVDAFHAAALGAGGRDNGTPGLRLNYHPHYYDAFILDPDGHNIEAVCHTAP
jgi:catechol 2,3-dioxygenase-like lactoylglutathione lyase family enzyme